MLTAFGLEQKGKWRAESLLKELELTEAKDQKLATYSTGMRQGYLWRKGTAAPPGKFCFLTNQLRLGSESAQNVNQMIHNQLAKRASPFSLAHQLRYAHGKSAHATD